MARSLMRTGTRYLVQMASRFTRGSSLRPMRMLQLRRRMRQRGRQTLLRGRRMQLRGRRTQLRESGRHQSKPTRGHGHRRHPSPLLRRQRAPPPRSAARSAAIPHPVPQPMPHASPSPHPVFHDILDGHWHEKHAARLKRRLVKPIQRRSLSRRPERPTPRSRPTLMRTCHHPPLHPRPPILRPPPVTFSAACTGFCFPTASASNCNCFPAAATARASAGVSACPGCFAAASCFNDNSPPRSAPAASGWSSAPPASVRVTFYPQLFRPPTIPFATAAACIRVGISSTAVAIG